MKPTNDLTLDTRRVVSTSFLLATTVSLTALASRLLPPTSLGDLVAFLAGAFATPVAVSPLRVARTQECLPSPAVEYARPHLLHPPSTSPCVLPHVALRHRRASPPHSDPRQSDLCFLLDSCKRLDSCGSLLLLSDPRAHPRLCASLAYLEERGVLCRYSLRAPHHLGSVHPGSRRHPPAGESSSLSTSAVVSVPR